MGDIMVVLPVDIIYIMDMSGSMLTTYFPPGDPYKKRDDALWAGFNYQIANLDSSRAGYIGFGTYLATLANYPALSGDHILAPVNVIAGQTQLQNVVNILYNDVEGQASCGGTRYSEAIGKAVEWLGDPAICPHDRKAIIFISDGEPNPGYSYTTAQSQFLVNNGVQVHGVFLGDDMGIALQDLADTTGGTMTLVSPLNNDTLEIVVEYIIESLNAIYIDSIFTEKLTCKILSINLNR